MPRKPGRGGAGRGQGRKPIAGERMAAVLRAPCTPAQEWWAKHVAESAGMTAAEWLRSLVDAAVGEHRCSSKCEK